MTDPKPYPQWLFWLLASTFLWGFLIAPLGIKKFIGWSEWSTLLGYPLICWAAAIFLLRSKRSGAMVFAAFHGMLGLAWIIFTIWASRAFAQGFWK